jgi:putative DNA methylase
VLWASLVDDPSSWPEKFPTEAEQTKERQRLFDILGRITIETDKKGNQKQVVRGLVSWDDIKDEQTINEAQREIARCLAWSRGEEPPTNPEAVRDYIAQHAPPVYDPFAGGGSIPLEAQRLGLEAHASDLNPVAVLINKALIEIPPRFKDCPPVNPDDRQRGKLESWKGAQGLAADVRYYGQWMRDEAFQRIGHLYPQVELPEGGKATVIAWIWARTVRCPNPACGCQMPLVRSFKLSTKKGRQAWVEPIVENDGDTEETKIRFEVKTGEGEIPEGTLRTKKGGKCIACDTPVPLSYLRSEGKAGNISQQLMAIIAEGKKGRTYLSPNLEHETVETPECDFLNNIDLAKISGYLNPPIYGYETIGSMLTNRQRLMINTFSELMPEVKKIILQNGADKEYAESICAYLTLAIGRVQNRSNGFAIWNNTGEKIEQAFSEQGVGMVWDFAEANPFSNSTGSWNGSF